MSALKFAACGGTAAPLYVDDVFSAYTYTGNGATQTITNGIDLAGKGGMVWCKKRDAFARQNIIYNSVIGNNYYLVTDSSGPKINNATDGLTGFTSTGFTLGADTANECVNVSTHPYVSWTFRNAPNFYGHQVVVKSAGSNQTALFPELTTLGMVRVKRTDAAGSWYVWHRSLTAGMLLIGETTAAEATLGHITVSGTTVTLVNGVIADGTYLVEAWAHDTGVDGIIQCGSFTTDGSGNATVTLGWEPQYVLNKYSSQVDNWKIDDSARGMTTDGSVLNLYPNSGNAEVSTGIGIAPAATGLKVTGMSPTQTIIYLAIRRPNKPPTLGTQVYNAITRTGTAAAATVTGVGFAPDLVIIKDRISSLEPTWFDRLRGATSYMFSSSTQSETSNATLLTGFDVMDGARLGYDNLLNVNWGNEIYINHFFRRAPGVFDIVCDTGTGSAHTIIHNLTVAPELMIRKGRAGATQWEVWHSGIANTEKLILNSTAAKATDTTAWNSTSPTASVFTVGTGANVNTNTSTYVTYLFATLAGISKVGSYTGNGSSLTLNMGFTTGCRFFMCKRTDSTGDWFVFDTVRGIVAGNDGHLSLNTTAPEVTTDDSVDPDSTGIIVNEIAATNINVTSATYIYLAFA